MGKYTDTKPSNYVKAKELKVGDKILFIEDGKWVTKDFSQARDGSQEKSVFVAKVSVNSAEPKELTINATSGKSLEAVWADSWKDKTALVSFVKMLAFGKMSDVLCLNPTDEKPGTEQGNWPEEG